MLTLIQDGLVMARVMIREHDGDSPVLTSSKSDLLVGIAVSWVRTNTDIDQD
jgi:hypothetical protein